MDSSGNGMDSSGNGKGLGRGRGRGGCGRADHKDQSDGQNQPSQGGGRGRPAPQHGSHQQPVQPPPPPPPPQAIPHESFAVIWTSGKPWTPSPSTPTSAKPWTPSPSTSTPPVKRSTPPPQATPQPFADKLDKLQSFPSSTSESKGQIQPIRRPDYGGTAMRHICLLVNYFKVDFDEERTIYHYDVDMKFLSDAPVTKALRKSNSRFIKDLLFPDDKLLHIAYDGDRNIFSAIKLPVREFPLEVSRSGSYMVAVKVVSELKLSKLKDYMRGNFSDIPRDILQGMDIVMKENPLRNGFVVGRRFCSCKDGVDLDHGLTAYKGFQQSLKPTSQGLSLCLDYSFLSFRQPLPVLEFLKQHVKGFNGVNDVKRFKREVERALQGLKVKVIYRRTNQKYYTITGLTLKDASAISFDHIDTKDKTLKPYDLPKYFKEKYGMDVKYPDTPCLKLGKNETSNQVPMEFCVLVDGQRYNRKKLEIKKDLKNAAVLLKNLSVAKPRDRMEAIDEIVRAEDGPFGEIAKNFGITLNQKMTKVMARVISPPQMRAGSGRSEKVDAEKCHWNLNGNSLVNTKSLERWAIIDFSTGGLAQPDDFICLLRNSCGQLGIQMTQLPLVHRLTGMVDITSLDRLEKLLKSVVEESSLKEREKLQMIVCVMAYKYPSGYKRLKWLSETKIGVVTQCLLASNANKKKEQFLTNLCLKINVKLGGNNFEVSGKFSPFDAGEHMMFIGAGVSHPSTMNKSCPSIAAIVGTVNWPAANRYATRFSSQAHCSEMINNFGELCSELVKTYARLNDVRPARIVVFRDGVSEGQFKMVLAEELLDLKRCVHDGDYKPPITVIVAQKRHRTRLFAENKGGGYVNVPPGTVVDRSIVHPRYFDFYLCSHYALQGMSTSTHYYVLWDENSFTSDGLQKLIYHMCFTFFGCTKPVSLVPPLYYADLAAHRGRLFQEASMERFGGPFLTAASDEENFCHLHRELEDTMFFV